MPSVKDYLIDKVRRVTQENLTTGMVDWTMTNIENPQIEFTGESKDKTDADGVLLARFAGAKGVTFSGEGSVISSTLLAAQLGAELEEADSETTITGKLFEVIDVVTSGSSKTATLTHTPKTAPGYIYLMTEDKNVGESLAVGSGGDDASISGKIITLPNAVDAAQIGVLYEFTATSGMKLTDKSEENAAAAGYIVDILAAEICNPAAKRRMTIVFPKAQIDNNFSINLTTEGTHPFSFSALKDYCSASAELCYFLFTE